jgi:hypothetical protein
MCNYSELASGSGLVYRNDLLTVTREQPGVTTDLGSDLTLVSLPLTRQTPQKYSVLWRCTQIWNVLDVVIPSEHALNRYLRPDWQTFSIFAVVSHTRINRNVKRHVWHFSTSAQISSVGIRFRILLLPMRGLGWAWTPALDQALPQHVIPHVLYRILSRTHCASPGYWLRGDKVLA